MKKFTSTVFFIIGCFCINGIGYAQQQQLYFENIDVKKGLPESSVIDIKEDSEGFIWMATQNGLVRYDGYRYKVYNLGSEKLNIDPVSNVQSLYLDKKNILWASTSSNGIFRYDRKTDTFKQFVYPFKQSMVIFYILAEGDSGTLWGTVDLDDAKNFVWKLTPDGKFEFFGNNQKGKHFLNASRIYSIVNSSTGKIWFATDNGFYRYNGKEKPLKGYMTSSDTLKQREAVYMYEPASEPGIFWMVTFHGHYKDSKVIRFDTASQLLKEYHPEKNTFNYAETNTFTISVHKTKFIKSIYEDKKKRLWFACDQGLLLLNRSTEKFTNYAPTGTEKLFTKKRLYNFLATESDNFWLSSGSGLVYFNPDTAKFKRYQADANHPGSINDGEILSKIIDHTNTLWVGYAWAGANKENKLKSAFGIYKQPSEETDISTKQRGYISAGMDGYSWYATENSIYKWFPETNTFKKVYAVDSGNIYFGNLTQTKERNLYIGSKNGLIFYNTHTGKKETYSLNKKSTTPANAFYFHNPLEDATGIIWLATNAKGICSFDPKTKIITTYPYRKNQGKITPQNSDALDDQRVISCHVDQENTLWVGTNYGGLNRFDRKTRRFISYQTQQSKKVTCVTSIFEDKTGRFWVGTYQNGLFEFDRKKEAFIHEVNEKSGLLFNGVLAINQDASGQLWILSERGLTRINPINRKFKNFKLENTLPGYDFVPYQLDLPKLDNGSFMLNLKTAIAIFNPKILNDNPYPPKVHLEGMTYSNPDSNDNKENNILTYGRKTIELPYNENRIRFDYIGLHYDNPSENKYAYKLDGYDKDWVQAGTQRTVTYTNLAAGIYTFHVKAANSDGVWSTKNDSISLIISPPWWRTWWAYLIYFVIFISLLRIYVVFRARNLKRENRILEEKVAHRTNQLSKSLEDLKTTQTQLIQSEKMASLGELTAGIAHEIQNPLNFVNNFSEVSMELLVEMEEELAKGETAEAIAIATDVKQNLEKINFHGKRADSIVKGMLQHSRTGNTVKESININALADEYLRLAYHGLRAKDKSFNADLVTNFDETLPKINVLPQDIGRVLLNLFTNAFYATHQKQKIVGGAYKPKVEISTSLKNNVVEITVKDNGTGIPDAIKDKILQPFFTTKPTGEGTGLGLSLSYDIVVKGHGGTILIDSVEDEYTVFTVQLPIE